MTTYQESDNTISAATDSIRHGKNIYRFVKRGLDVLCSLVGIILMLLPMLVIALAIRLHSPGSALFRQRRIGLNGKVFTILKFRTMYQTAPHETSTEDLVDAGKHITRFGAFLRKTSIDELPQLFNVLRGDMSFIGPRPLIVSEKEVHRLRMQSGVYCIRPGITGWAQINGRDCIDAETKVYLDTEYLHNYSFTMDLKIALNTLFVVSSGDGYSEGRKSDQHSAINSIDNNAA